MNVDRRVSEAETQPDFHQGAMPASHLLLLIAVVFLCTLPFINKAFHIDDVYFIEIAETIRTHPFQPFYGAATLVDQDFLLFSTLHKKADTFDVMSHPPLVPYYIAVISFLQKRFDERGLHLGFIIFPILSSFACYSLAGRFTGFPLIGALLLVVSPIFIVNASNIMTDIPMLALFLSALAVFIRSVDGKKKAGLYLSGFLGGLALLTRYVAFALIPLFLVYVLIQRKQLRLLIPPLLVMAFIFGLWCLQNLHFNHAIHVLASAQYYKAFYRDYSFSKSAFGLKLISNLAALGVVAPFPIALALSKRFSRNLLFGCAALAVSFVCIYLELHRAAILRDYSLNELLALGVLSGMGVWLILLTMVTAFRVFPSKSEDALFLLLWFCGMFISSIIFLPFGTGRYMVPVLPPAFFILLNESGPLSQPIRRLAGGALVVSAVLGLCLSIADYQYASVYRSFAEMMRTSYPQKRIWFIGEWGFRFYMERFGCRLLLSTDNSPVPGDVIVRANIAGMNDFSPALKQRMQFVKTIAVQNSFPLRTMNLEAHAGFYAHGFGLLPFAVSNAPMEHFDLFEIRQDLNRSN